MPEGIVPELLITAFLLAVIGFALFVGRRRDREAPPEPQPRAAPDLVERPVVEVESRFPAPEVAEEQAEAVRLEAPAPEEAAAPSAPVVAPARPSLRERLARSRRFLADRLGEVFTGGVADEVWDDLEAVLIQADLGADLARKITADVRERARERGATDLPAIRGLLHDELVTLFSADEERTLAFAPDGPTVWLIVGVNGTGKTTTVGKLAADLTARGRTVALAAADTFRAAADEQLGVWAERSRAEIVKHQPGADPGAVAYDALQHARAAGIDVLLVDTAGRLHTKTPLMDELAKIRRVIEKEARVQETLLVIDATAGQNGLVQAREFTGAAGVSGVVLTKLDGTAKGGIAVAIENDLGIPIKLVGLGEGIDDLEPFDPKTFVDALLS